MQYVNLCELYLFYKVDDIKAAMTELKKKKIRILSEEPKIGAHGKPVIFLHPKDCHGVLVELEQAWAAIFINKTIEELWSSWAGAENIDVVFSLYKFTVHGLSTAFEYWKSATDLGSLFVVVADLIFRINMLAFLEFSVILIWARLHMYHSNLSFVACLQHDFTSVATETVPFLGQATLFCSTFQSRDPLLSDNNIAYTFSSEIKENKHCIFSFYHSPSVLQTDWFMQ